MNDTFYKYEVIPHTQLNNVNFFLINSTYCAPHLHKDFEIIQVIEGTLHINTFGEEYDIGPGEIALFNSNQYHTFKSKESSCILLTIQISPAFFTMHYPAIRNIHFDTSNVLSVIPSEMKSDIIKICLDFGYNYYSGALGFEFRCVSDLYKLFWHFITYIPNHMLQESELLSNEKNKLRLIRILSYMHQHYSEKITLSEIAERENLSMNYLSHLFKKYINVSFQEYVNAIRFEHAIFLLKQTDMNITDICLNSGFSDSKYLNKLLLQTYKMTPKKFRQSIQLISKSEESERQVDESQYIYSYTQGFEIMRKHFHFDCDDYDLPSKIELKK